MKFLTIDVTDLDDYGTQKIQVVNRKTCGVMFTRENWHRARAYMASKGTLSLVYYLYSGRVKPIGVYSGQTQDLGRVSTHSGEGKESKDYQYGVILGSPFWNASTIKESEARTIDEYNASPDYVVLNDIRGSSQLGKVSAADMALAEDAIEEILSVFHYIGTYPTRPEPVGDTSDESIVILPDLEAIAKYGNPEKIPRKKADPNNKKVLKPVPEIEIKVQLMFEKAIQAVMPGYGYDHPWSQTPLRIRFPKVPGYELWSNQKIHPEIYYSRKFKELWLASHIEPDFVRSALTHSDKAYLDSLAPYIKDASSSFFKPETDPKWFRSRGHSLFVRTNKIDLEKVTFIDLCDILETFKKFLGYGEEKWWGFVKKNFARIQP